VPGRTVTVDRAQLALTPGQRFSRAALTLGIRSSKGGHHQIELPDQANLQAVTIDGRSLPVRQDGRLVTVPLEPGARTVGATWLQLNDSMTLIRGPRVDIGVAAVNAAVTFNMPAQRWILFAGGPNLGPAVLFWSYVIVVMVAAMGLGKTHITPLRTHQWILLGLGLTQVPAGVAVLVVGWLMALGYRCRMGTPDSPLAFDLIQVLLVIFTLAALTGLYSAIERGLLGIPDMQIAGNHSTRFQLNWFQDRINGHHAHALGGKSCPSGSTACSCWLGLSGWPSASCPGFAGGGAVFPKPTCGNQSNGAARPDRSRTRTHPGNRKLRIRLNRPRRPETG
jgi:hypothetical protein